MSPDDGTIFWLTLAGTLAAGWGATVWYQERRRRRRVRRRERYLEGLRYLLDEKPERALEVFHGLAAVDDETVDTHFALGSLYRRSGEVDRAIQVHQNIVARNNLDERHRDAALTELARDYFRAGLYDRAEELFQKLAREGGSRLWRSRTSCGSTRSSATGRRPPRRTSACAPSACPSSPARSRTTTASWPRPRLPSATCRRRTRICGAPIASSASSGAARSCAATSRGSKATRRSPCGSMAVSCSATFTCCRSCCRGSPRWRGSRATSGVLIAVIDDLIRRGAASRAEIAYAAILSGHYDSPPIVDCVREWLQIDSDLKDLTGAFLAPGAAPTRRAAPRAVGRDAQCRAAPRALPVQPVRARQLDVSLELPGLPCLGHAARDRRARVPAARRASARPPVDQHHSLSADFAEVWLRPNSQFRRMREIFAGTLPRAAASVGRDRSPFGCDATNPRRQS